MFYLINTFSQPAVVVSSHRTLPGARRAESKLQRDVKRHNGNTSYLPTTIGEGTKRIANGTPIRFWDEVSKEALVDVRDRDQQALTSGSGPISDGSRSGRQSSTHTLEISHVSQSTSYIGDRTARTDPRISTRVDTGTSDGR
jgi:hypothetical protein